MDIGFASNYTNLHLIDTTPNGDERTWAYIGPGITSIETDNEDTTDDTAYYDGGGAASEDVTGVSLGYKIEGDRKFGDPAQDFIAGLVYETGEGRKTNYKRIAPDGRTVEGRVTVKDIVAEGGEANDKNNFEATVKFDGLPTVGEPTKTELPESVTLSAISVAAGNTTQASPTVTPATASAVCVYAVEDDSIATVDAMGNVTGVRAGTTKITAKCIAKPSVNVTANVTVTGTVG